MVGENKLELKIPALTLATHPWLLPLKSATVKPRRPASVNVLDCGPVGSSPKVAVPAVTVIGEMNVSAAPPMLVVVVQPGVEHAETGRPFPAYGAIIQTVVTNTIGVRSNLGRMA
jgi:hypothetical protein